MNKRGIKKLRIIEFLVIGVFMGLLEDILAVFLATGHQINFKIILLVLLVAVPFAMISELLVDHPAFWGKLLGQNRAKRLRGEG